MAGFAAGVAGRPWIQFGVSGEKEEEGDDCWKGVPPKRKTVMELNFSQDFAEIQS